MRCKSLYVVAIFLLARFTLQAQENLSVYNEPEISIGIGTDTPWSFDFGMAHRRLVYANEEYAYVAKNIELSHFTHYKLEGNVKIGLGLKYKFTELFSETAHDKFLIMQQLGYGKKYGNMKLSYRLRLEERFQDGFSFRPRYKLGAEWPLSTEKNGVDGFSFAAKTETLYTIYAEAKPKLDQRFAIEFEKGLTKNVAIEIGLEYQYEDYLHDPEVDLFILSGLSIDL